MFQILEIGTPIFECFLVHIFFHNWFGRRVVPRWRFAATFLCYFLTNVVCTLSPLLPLVRSLVSIVCVAVVVWLLYDATPLFAVSGSVLYMGLAVLAEYSTMAVMNTFSFDTTVLMEYGQVRAIYIAFAKLIHLAFVLIVSAVLSRNHGPLKVQQIIPLLPCQIISMYICQVFYRVSRHTNDLSGSFVFVLLGLLYINAISVAFLQNMAARSVLQQEKTLAEQNFVLQQAYYAQVQQDQSETHALWHDIKKYVLAIQAMIADQGNEDAVYALQELQNECSRLGDVVDVENPELNVILNHCVQKAKAAGVYMTLDASVPHKLSVSAVDLSIIIGNTMDNAIEACQPLEPEQKTIAVMLRYSNQMLFYTIDNPCSKCSAKKPGTIHGYGLKNVKRCVEKYQGTFLAEQNESGYHVSIRLNTAQPAVVK